MTKISSVCIIDDDPIIIYGSKRIMKELDFSSDILVFSNGKEAIDSFITMNDEGRQIPELIFLDLNMPVMNGWDFLENFMKLPPEAIEQVSVYIISSSIDPMDLERVRDYPVVNDYILKPLKSRDVQAVVESLKMH